MSGDDAVHGVEQRSRNARGEARGETGERHGLQEPREPGPVAGHGSVVEREPPRRVPLVFGKPVQERRGSKVAQREECKLLVPVDEDDDTRRPGTETSASVVEQDRPAKLSQLLLGAR